jgi:hypothetical protein
MSNDALELSDKAIEVIDIFASSEEILNISDSADGILFMSEKRIHKDAECIFDLFLLSVLDNFVLSYDLPVFL